MVLIRNLGVYFHTKLSNSIHWFSWDAGHCSNCSFELQFSMQKEWSLWRNAPSFKNGLLWSPVDQEDQKAYSVEPIRWSNFDSIHRPFPQTLHSKCSISTWNFQLETVCFNPNSSEQNFAGSKNPTKFAPELLTHVSFSSPQSSLNSSTSYIVSLCRSRFIWRLECLFKFDYDDQPNLNKLNSKFTIWADQNNRSFSGLGKRYLEPSLAIA